MVNIILNGQNVSVKEGTTIMEAAEKNGISIPHLCFLKDLNEIGACRVCVVEVRGYEKLVTACNTICEEGMDILTNSPRGRRTRRTNVELILSDHNANCTSCVKSGNCLLQKTATDIGIFHVPYENIAEKAKWEWNIPLLRDASKCIKCMRCVQVCEKIQGLGVWDLKGTGYRTTIGVKENEALSDADCALCGQCITHCPVGALRARDDRAMLNDALEDPEMVTMVQIAPAVRTAWGEPIGMDSKDATLGKLVCALKKIGVDYVFDTNFTADLTIMEEGSELLERLKNSGEHKWPMFTSCCPGWLRFVRTKHPELVENLSTAKSPQQMFGAMSKTYIAYKLGINPDKIFSVSIMPCVAKKFERAVTEVNDSGHGNDVDLVLTTRELDRFIKADNIKPEDLEEMPFDDFFGEGTGAATIFGTTGGVMEAALRSAYFLVTGENPQPDTFKEVRGMDGWKEAKFNLAGAELNVAIASGLGNTEKLIEAVESGKAKYDFVEIMACPGGCVGGGGQPFTEKEQRKAERADTLYELDAANEKRFSHENKAVQMAYEEFLGEPLSERSHHLLHTDLSTWDLKIKSEQ